MTVLLFAHDGYVAINSHGIFSESYNKDIVERYFKFSNNVTFLVRKKAYNNEGNFNRLDRENFKVVGLENFNSIKGIFNSRNINSLVEKEVKNSSFIIARLPSKVGFLAVKYAKKHEKKYLIEVVGCPWDSLRNHSFLGKLIAPSYYLKQKRIIRHSLHTIYVTNKFLQKRYPTNGESIGSSDVQIKDLSTNVIIDRHKKILNTDLKSLKLGTIGALNMKYKGFDTVIKSISYLNKNGYSFEYEIIGSGDSSWLEKVIKKHRAEDFVTIKKHIDHERIFMWLDKIDIYIQPSKTEGMPRALIEALSRGLPAIGTKAGGITELLEEDCLISNDKRNISELIKLLKNIDLNSMLSKSERNFNEANKYEMKKLESKRNQFYESFIKEGFSND